ncbi:spore cortex biosynthesis protein YabQ [Sulfoacidibacillus thermotolerans]|uniref:Spore cortex biosynthesis protein YabQ n=1 Tax=Sulfoacidibacillus thermotolerans TaxID=1765684 RepID=A0A2U3DAZ8_SULT2|nr:spore cortex biosynthesis protein YabQ [Sulfoacidibacillus thermotolerans]PWI58453.1 spore cortex biosynthesis protein YabQ [Sulfoacidibacillus thermotolerans]
MELQAQYATAILMSAAGAALGAVYDIYRTCIKEWRFLRIYSALLDFLFWVFALIFVFTLLLGANDGDVRLVVFVLLTLGWLIYYKIAHPLVVASTRLVVRVVYSIVRFIYRVFVAVVVMPFVYLFKILITLLRFFDQGLRILEVIIVWPLGKLGMVLRLSFRGLKKIVRPWWRKGKDKARSLANKYKKLISKWLHGATSTDEDDEDET